jgi:hypothetical protein
MTFNMSERHVEEPVARMGHSGCVGDVHGRWNTMTFLAALRHDRIDARFL